MSQPDRSDDPGAPLTPEEPAESRAHPRFTPRSMVDWLDPWHLMTTGLQMLIARWVGQGRSMEAAARSDRIHRFGTRDELWFDYTADTGDGWDSTFTVASLIAQPRLEVGQKDLPRGEFLVIGGDLVYPVPDRERYNDRFWGPFGVALSGESGRMKLLAIPGNHDWYDGLVSFSREFTQHREVDGWETVQDQSYFAAQLPHRWWLWAMDVLPGARMDYGQRKYFEAAALELAPGDKVILLAGSPDWIQGYIQEPEESHFWTVEKALIEPRKAEVRVWLAGDLHHYRRHERREPPKRKNAPENPSELEYTSKYHRITSGGGGAFLAQSHRPRCRSVVVGDHEYDLRAAFPSPVTSFRLGLMVLGLAARCWKFGVFPMGLLYWLLTWGPLPLTGTPFQGLRELFDHPGPLFWVLLVLWGCLAYADNQPRWFRWTVGFAHGVAHILVAAVVTGAINAAFLRGAPGVWDFVAASILNFLAGMLCGPTVFGAYLWVSLNLFGAHRLEAFSSLRIADYKHFLRFHVDKDGLDIYPIGVRKVPRGGQGLGQYRLIEKPIKVPTE